MDSRGINQRKKYFVKKLNNFRCSHCKNIFSSEELEVDHIIAIANGGTNDYSNLQCLCIDCHIKKTQGELIEGYGENKNIYLTPEEQLEILKTYLEENKDKTYAEIQFLILNNKILSKFYYNSTTLGLLYKQVKGIIKNKNSKEIELKEQRNLMIKGLYKEISSLRKLSNKLKEWGINLGRVQLGLITKVKYDEDNEDEQDIKDRKKDIEETELEDLEE